MYGKKRIVLSNDIAHHTGYRVVAKKGGGNYNPVGVWYYEGGKYYADLKAADEMYKTMSSRDLGIKRFGGVATKNELRDMIARNTGWGVK
jgi:hypothetical protein